MKKIIILSALVAISMALFSQTSYAYITLANQEEMKGTFLSITDTSITIKPDGSIQDSFTIPADKLIYGTIYSDNGKVELSVVGNRIVAKSRRQEALTALGITWQTASKDAIKNDAYSLPTARPRQYSSSQKQKYDFVVRKGNKYYVGISEYSKKEFLDFLKTNNPTAYNHYNTGYRTANIGWGLFGGGLAGTLIGTIIVATARTSSANNAGIFFASVGSSCLISSTICLGVGYGRMHNSADIYNIQTEHKRLMQLSINTSGSNFGLALTW